MSSFEIIAHYRCGDMAVLYVKKDDVVGLLPVPAAREQVVLPDKGCSVEPLVQVRLTGDDFGSRFSNGLTLRDSETVAALRLQSHSREGDTVITVLEDGRGHRVKHFMRLLDEYSAAEVWSEFENLSEKTARLELLSSFSLGNLTPFSPHEKPGTLRLHRLRSFWSAEGRLTTNTVEELGLEPSWLEYGLRAEVFGTVGSMPVRSWFPFAAVEDTEAGVLWGAQLYCASSWQMEAVRFDSALILSGGLGDYDRAHWQKDVAPGGCFQSPRAVIAACEGDIDDLCHVLTAAQRRGWENAPEVEKELPVVFNEWCTSWGTPTTENVTRIADAIKGRGIQYFIIDAGWYADPVYGWQQCMGDWVPNGEAFPTGLKAAADAIRERGMIPGLWFEMETAGKEARAFQQTDHLLKRDGTTVTVGTRRFWDMEDPWVQEHLGDRVIGTLRENGFGYLKVDYNETIGVGCDGYESSGEGLRRKVNASQEFFKRIRREIPELVIENCSSGGHRLEPSMMALCSQASFSDAHECLEIPVIAANVHRAILPCQSQIWAVLRAGDSDDRLWYLLAGAMLGRMCLSGEIYDLSEHQWDIVTAGIAFYKKAAPVIDRGKTRKLTPETACYRVLTGVQAVWRSTDGAALLVVHRFQSDKEKSIPLPSGWHVSDTFGGGAAKVESGVLTVAPGSYTADAFLLERD